MWSAGGYSASGIPESVSLSDSSGSTVGETESTNWSRSRASSLVPFVEAHQFRELSSVTFRSLEEQLYLKKLQMKRQEQQHAAILIPGAKVELGV
jgi:hypothetical protein